MKLGPFDSFPIFLVYIGITLFIYFSFEIGYQIGKRTSTPHEKDAPSALGPMVGGVLAMLGFVLAFTFSMVASHHDHRKQNVLDDANAIGTVYLLADLVEKPQRTEIKSLLREYVDVRLQRKSDQEHVGMMLGRSDELQKRLWAQALSVAKRDPGGNTGLLIRSMNRMLEMHEKRVTTALRNRIPKSIWLTLFAISALTMITIGVQAGITQWRRLVAVIPLLLAFAALTTVIVDLDRPLSGVIKVGQEAMIDLQGKMVQTGN